MKKVNYELMRGGSFTNKNDNLSTDWREYYLVLTPMGASYGL
jgi:hypothetical protein